MTAWILAVGSELLTPFKVDTNSLAITEALNAIGYDVRRKVVLADDLEALTDWFAGAVGHTDLVVCTGGLGPTADDLTRDAVARALGRPLAPDAGILARIEARFQSRGRTMPAINARQALVPQGAIALENTQGTAPGLWLAAEGTSFLLLPGPPREMRPLLTRAIEALIPSADGVRLLRRVIKLTGRPESEVDAIAQPIYGPWATAPLPVTTTILASLGQIELHLTATSADTAAATTALEAAVATLCAALAPSVYSTDGRTLEVVVADRLRAARRTVATAESCTGGLLASRMTDVPGSSVYFRQGVVSYSNEAKQQYLGVPAALLAQHGAVSAPVAVAMADGIRAASGADVGLGITGIAGPDGGSAEKPVGTVVIALSSHSGTRCETFRFVGPREMVKFQSAQAALNMLRLALEAEGTA